MTLLRIREAQLAALDAAAFDRFVDSVAPLIREQAGPAAAAMDDGELCAAIGAAMRRAQSYGIAADCDLVAFATLALTISPRFDEHPRFQRLLASPSVEPRHKIGRLFAAATAADWDEAAGL